MSAGKVIGVVVGAVVGLLAIGLIAGGSFLLWANATQRDADGFFTSPDYELVSDGYAVVSEEVDLSSVPGSGDWWPGGNLAIVRLAAMSDGGDVFVGIGPASDVDIYLDGVGRAEVIDLGRRAGDVRLSPVAGGAPATAPGDETFWVATAEGGETQTLEWDVERGEWVAVIMNADASAGVSVVATAAAAVSILTGVAIGLLVVGLLLGAIAALVLVLSTRGRPAVEPVPHPAAPSFGPYPVRLEGELDPELSRWLWIVKFFMVIPHIVVLVFLWAAFVVLTIGAFFAILFTGRYPRGIFDFNVGVMRWTWRVSFYSYGMLGTDQYPPFTLEDVDYPARLDVAYPEQLSRGLVLVKWWLLAIPHYLIVGLLTSGLVWWSESVSGDNTALQFGGGLIGLLVLIAGFVLLFTGRYPHGLFDLVMGLQRWVFRVGAYAGLMRDEYPPFRLDTGGTEAAATAAPEPAPSG
ncbi:MAG TPA: DUF4389 domain-containing protein [Acidimicrobiia bacterium]|jgi:hypothetical protein